MTKVISDVKRFFTPSSLSIEIIDAKLTDHRYTIYDIILRQPSDALDARICFKTLFENVRDKIEIKVSPNQPEQQLHSIDIKLIQKLVASVNLLITQIDMNYPGLIVYYQKW